MAAAVIAHGGADVLRYPSEVSQEILDRQIEKTRMLLERAVEVAHIRGVMFPVVNLHRTRIDVRFERVKRVGQIRERMQCHRWNSFAATDLIGRPLPELFLRSSLS